MNARTVIAGILLLGLGAGCSPLPAESAPRTIDKSKVSALFSIPTTTLGASAITGKVCFVPQSTDNSHPELECKVTELKSLDVQSLFDALATGPTEPQRKLGLSSYVPRDTRLLGAEADPTDPSVLVINVSKAINIIGSPNNSVAFKQIVQTLTMPANQTDGNSYTAVRVKVDGKPIKIPTVNGPVAVAETSDFKPVPTTTARRSGSGR